MALTIEDGKGVDGATSYVTIEEARAYASARGVTLSATDSAVEILLIRSMDYIESYREQFKGTRTYGADGVGQYLQWPRTDVVIDGVLIAIDAIPPTLKNLQCQLAIEMNSNDPMATQSGQVVRREKVDVIETEYAVSTRSTTDRVPRPSMPRVDALLKTLIRNFGVTVVRA